jgi:hypothetical protein
MKWFSLLIAPLALAATEPRSAEGIADFLLGFAKNLPESRIEILKAEAVAGARIPERPTETRHVVTFLHRVRNISRVYQLCVVESAADQSQRYSLGRPDDLCQDELLANFARVKAGGLGEKEKNTLQGLLWAESEPAVVELETELKDFWAKPASPRSDAASTSDPSSPASPSPRP